VVCIVIVSLFPSRETHPDRSRVGTNEAQTILTTPLIPLKVITTSSTIGYGSLFTLDYSLVNALPPSLVPVCSHLSKAPPFLRATPHRISPQTDPNRHFSTTNGNLPSSQSPFSAVADPKHFSAMWRGKKPTPSLQLTCLDIQEIGGSLG
jgi:hypothetical protein